MNPYASIEAKVLNIFPESQEYITIEIEPREEVKFDYGQFMRVSLKNSHELTLFPISNIHDKTLKFTVNGVTVVPGDRIGIRGPFGNPYPLKEFIGKELLLLTDVNGLPALRNLFLALLHDLFYYKKIKICCFVENKEHLIYREEFLDNWIRMSPKIKVNLVEPDLKKFHPVLQELSYKNCIVITFVKRHFLKDLVSKLVEIGYEEEQIYSLMLTNIICGIGKCGHCRLGNLFVCKDGPLFKYSLIKSSI